GLLDDPVAEEIGWRAERAELLDHLVGSGVLSAPAAPEDEIVRAMHDYLAGTPSRYVLAAPGDAVGDLRQPNLPGTVDEYPKWRLPVADADGRPLLLDELLADPRVERLAARCADRAIARAGRGTTTRCGSTDRTSRSRRSPAPAPAPRHEEAPVPSGEPFTDGQVREISRACATAGAESGLHFSVYAGSVDGDVRDQAERLHAALGALAPRAVLVLVSPGDRQLEIVTGRDSSRRLSDRACALAALSM